MKWDEKWIPMGKLKEFSCDDSLCGVGIVKLSVCGTPVYLVRALELNNGGLSKKIAELQMLKINRKSKAYTEIAKNMENIDIDVICVGNNLNAVDISRKLEKELLQKYKPIWM